MHEFTQIGATIANRIAVQSGGQWSALAEAWTVPRSTVFHDDGSGGGPALYAAGEFQRGRRPGSEYRTLDGSGWEPVGGGIGGAVLALAPFDDGSGAKLFAGRRIHLGGRICGELPRLLGRERVAERLPAAGSMSSAHSPPSAAWRRGTRLVCGR
ncbi:MAG: hypothetical protein R3F11_20490 [Verrucomicrobiales bacterium]